MDFRKDINGLRAFAVIAVVVFHFNSSWLPGGFAGVDVFFVISGYLMTKIIVTGLQNTTFSFLSFYTSRAKRIIPALAFASLVLMLFGWFFLSAVDYTTLSKHAMASLGFFSNLYYLSEAGYFDESSSSKWLLHTWSLSVEWQFYLIYPIMLSALYAYLSFDWVRKTVVLAFVLSFVFCVYLTINSPDAAFYILPTRAWEMILGGLAFLYPISLGDRYKKPLEVLGITLILGSYFLVSENESWPGFLAMVPVIGAYFVILANNANSRITAGAVLQFFGKTSYSIYLWHWPILLGLLYFGFDSSYSLVSGMLLSIVAGYLSFSLIESKSSFKLTSVSIHKILLFPPFVFTTVLCVIFFIIYNNNGVPSRLDPRIDIAARESTNKASFDCVRNEAKKDTCIIGNKNNIVAIVLGDSHAKALTSAVAEVIDTTSEGLLSISSPACPFVKEANITSNKGCYKSNKATLNQVKEIYPNRPVFIINRTSVYIYGQSDPIKIKAGHDKPLVYFDSIYESVTEGLLRDFDKYYRETVCSLAESNTVFITTPVPEMLTNLPKSMANRMLIHRDFGDYSVPLSAHLERNAYAIKLINESARQCNAHVLNIEKMLCTEGACKGSENGRPLYFDDNHLSEFGNKYLTPIFKEAMINGH